MGFSALAHQFAPWSLSKAQASSCPFKFNVQYVQHKSGAKKHADTKVGTAVHEVLEKVLAGGDFQSAMTVAALKHELTTPEVEDLKSYAHNIKRFIERFEAFKTKKQITEQFLEKKFGMTDDRQNIGFSDHLVFFRGVWDIAMRSQNGYMIIIDHKSGTVKPIDTYADQLNLYAVAAICMYPDLLGVQSAVHYVQSEEVVWSPVHSADYIRRELFPWFENYIEEAAKRAQLQHAVQGWYCEYCEYTIDCPLRK